MAASPTGRFAVSGDYTQGVAVGTEQLQGKIDSDGFLFVFDADAAPRWSRAFSDNGNPADHQYAGYLGMDGANQTTVVVSFNESVFIDGKNYDNGSLVLKYSPDGQTLWINEFDLGSTIYGFALDPLGHARVSGSFTAPLDLDIPDQPPLELDNDGMQDRDLFVAGLAP